tara:strand:- start:7839 stop:8129 length:291 start_codon:yes stop_codon:yes gene_type:complete
MNVKLEEINLSTNNFYNASCYPKSGLFIVKSDTSTDVVFVDVLGNFVLYISTFDIFKKCVPEIDEQKTKEVSSGISEDLFLKTMSLLANKDESYKK